MSCTPPVFPSEDLRSDELSRSFSDQSLVIIDGSHKLSPYGKVNSPRFDVTRRPLAIQAPSKFRRGIERIVAATLLVLISPVLLVLALAVQLTSPGGIFYQQIRLGLDGRPFDILKFRSMVAGAENGTGAVWATKNDPRVTVIGHYMRMLHLDELPQLINIVRGEMLFVGPRPERPEIISELEQQIPGYRYRLDVMPGVTGLAQVNLDPDESIHSVKRKFELDIEYIYNATPLLDLRIVLTTMLKMCRVPKKVATTLFRIHRVPKVPENISTDMSESWWDNSSVTAERKEFRELEAVG